MSSSFHRQDSLGGNCKTTMVANIWPEVGKKWSWASWWYLNVLDDIESVCVYSIIQTDLQTDISLCSARESLSELVTDWMNVAMQKLKFTSFTWSDRSNICHCCQFLPLFFLARARCWKRPPALCALPRAWWRHRIKGWSSLWQNIDSIHNLVGRDALQAL